MDITSSLSSLEFRRSENEACDNANPGRTSGIVERAPEHIEIITAETRIKQYDDDFAVPGADGEAGDGAEAESEQ